MKSRSRSKRSSALRKASASTIDPFVAYSNSLRHDFVAADGYAEERSGKSAHGCLPVEDFLQEFLPSAPEVPHLPALHFPIPLPCDIDPATPAAFYNMEHVASTIVRGH